MRSLIAATLIAACAADVGYDIVTPTGYTRLRSGKFNGTLYSVDVSSKYDLAPSLLDLYGTYYQQGFDAGFVLGNEMKEGYGELLMKFLGNSTLEPLEAEVIGLLADWQYNDVLSVQLPQEYKDEIRGVDDGAAANGVKGIGQLVARIAVLANMPGSLEDFIYVLMDEIEHQSTIMNYCAEHSLDIKEVMQKFVAGFDGFKCSMFGAWGDRTNNGHVFTGRNLDWNSNSGINKFKLITVFHPPNGIAHATAGFAGLMGALTGMSAKGLTVHEANLEEKPDTFRGFAWIYRLRYIMERAANLAQAKHIWETTNNTCGFNHMVGSAPDQSALVMETRAFYTAYFRDNDPREASATVFDSATNQSVKVGFPLPQAVWRTNHGYDPSIMKNFLWGQGPNSDTQFRYMIIHDALTAYAQAGVKIGPDQAVNITAIVGQKGQGHFYHCGDTHSGSNVLSVAFDPNELTMYAAWEAFSGAAWRPAGCNSYVKFDMKQWF